ARGRRAASGRQRPPAAARNGAWGDVTWPRAYEIGLVVALVRQPAAPGQNRKRPIGDVLTFVKREETPHFVSGMFRNVIGSSSWISDCTRAKRARASSRSNVVLRRSRSASTSGFL